MKALVLVDMEGATGITSDGFMARFLYYYLQPYYMPVVRRLKEGSR